MALKQALTEQLRLLILQLLQQADGYDLNDDIIRAGLAEFGHRPSIDSLHTQLAWLSQQGFVTTQVLCGGSTWVARLSPVGCDVATGNITMPGVRRPRPRD